MANWATNIIEFTGKNEHVVELSKFVIDAMNKQSKTYEGKMINAINECIDGYFFDICNLHVEEGWLTFQYQSKWSPNIEDCKVLARQFELNFHIEYEEMGNDLYGRQKYEHETDQLFIKEVSDSDLNKASYYVHNETDEQKFVLEKEDDGDDYYTDYNMEELDDILNEYEWIEI
jgi:hypothetical protein